MAQCGEDLMKQALNAMGTCQYLKDFDVRLASGAGDGQKFPVVLQSRTKYQINIANGKNNSENVAIEIYDGDTKIVSNVVNDKVYTTIQFKCTKTGPYRFRMFSAGKTESCARAVLSLVEQYSE